MKPKEAIELLENLKVCRQAHLLFNIEKEAVDMAIEALKEQRPRGRWIDEGLMADGHPQHAFKCSEYENHEVCIPSDIPHYHFCSNCGSDNRKSGEDTPKEHEDKKTKKCPNCGSDLYEYCFMCCYEGKKVKRSD